LNNLDVNGENIEIGPIRTEFAGVDWIQLAQDQVADSYVCGN